MELLLGTGKGNIQQVQVIHKHLHLLVEVIIYKYAAGQISLIFYRNKAEPAERLPVRPAPHKIVMHGVMVRPPVPERDDNNLELQPLGLVNGHYPYGILPVAAANRESATILLPPFCERPGSSCFFFRIIKHDILKGHQVGNLSGNIIQSEN